MRNQLFYCVLSFLKLEHVQIYWLKWHLLTQIKIEMTMYFIQNMLYKPPFELLLSENNIVCMVGQNNYLKYDGFNILPTHLCYLVEVGVIKAKRQIMIRTLI